MNALQAVVRTVRASGSSDSDSATCRRFAAARAGNNRRRRSQRNQQTKPGDRRACPGREHRQGSAMRMVRTMTPPLLALPFGA